LEQREKCWKEKKWNQELVEPDFAALIRKKWMDYGVQGTKLQSKFRHSKSHADDLSFDSDSDDNYYSDSDNEYEEEAEIHWEEENKTKTNVPVKRKEEKTESEEKISTIQVRKIQEDADLWNGVE
jgi:hypothetical protein